MNDRLTRLWLPILMLSACSPVATAAPPLAGSGIGGHFTLTDQNGRAVSDSAFRGKYRIVYFGYTYCPDVCPVDMQNIGGAMKLLERDDPALAARIVPIFISVDPARDTPPVLKQFVGAFGPRFVGLTGTPAQIAAVAKDYAVFYKPQPASGDGGYTVNHSRQAYLFGPAGDPLALLPQDKSPADIAAEIKRWAT